MTPTPATDADLKEIAESLSSGRRLTLTELAQEHLYVVPKLLARIEQDALERKRLEEALSFINTLAGTSDNPSDTLNEICELTFGFIKPSDGGK